MPDVNLDLDPDGFAEGMDAAEPEPEALPEHKADLVALAIDRGIASYEAWDMTVPQLRKKLEA